MQVEPKRQELAAANDKLLAANTRLKEVQEKVAALNAQVKQLEDQYSLVSLLPCWLHLWRGKMHCSRYAHNTCQQLVTSKHAVGQCTMQPAMRGVMQDWEGHLISELVALLITWLSLGELLCRLWVRRTLPLLRASAASASWAWPTDSLLPWHQRASAGRRRCSSCARTIRSADSCRSVQAAILACVCLADSWCQEA